MSPAIDPAAQFRRFGQDFVLNVMLMHLIAGEGKVESRQNTGGLPFAQLITVEPIRLTVLIAEEQPSIVGSFPSGKLLKKTDKRRYSNPWTDHDKVKSRGVV